MEKSFKIIVFSLFLLFAVCMVAAVTSCYVENEDEYYLIYSAGEGGYIEGNAEQTVKGGDDGETVKAVANEYYRFVKWSDGLTTPERHDTNITEDKTVEAKFKKVTVIEPPEPVEPDEPDKPEPKPQFTVTYIAEEGGYIDGKAVQTLEEFKFTQTVVAMPETGYKFVGWDDGKTAPERRDLNTGEDETFVAKFERIVLTVKYKSDEDSLIIITESGKRYSGAEIVFKVNYGEDCEKIKSVTSFFNHPIYLFVRWSDGIETAERQETNVTTDITIKAKLGYELTYKVASGKGRIEGKLRQMVGVGEYSEPVEAVADEGYVFCGWSDMIKDTTHRVYEFERSREFVAYFELIEKTFKYDYGSAVPLKTQITLNREKLNEAIFEIPARDGYSFRGWYADSEYKQKVVHESGKLMLGLQTLNLETDTLYARWEKTGEETKTYKILMIMVDEIYAYLYSSRIETDVLIDYKMSGVERKLCSVIPAKVSHYLNKWFEGKVIFEIDTYFTREVVNKNEFHSGLSSTKKIDYWIMGDKLEEITDIIDEYECTLVTHNMDDYDSLVHSVSTSGMGWVKHGTAHLESKLFKNFPNQIIVEETMNYNLNGEVYENYRGLTTLLTYFHEFCHTIEMRYYIGFSDGQPIYKDGVYDFHKCIMPNNQLDSMRLYLLKQLIIDDKIVGIPESYWEQFYN